MREKQAKGMQHEPTDPDEFGNGSHPRCRIPHTRVETDRCLRAAGVTDGESVAGGSSGLASMDAQRFPNLCAEVFLFRIG